MIKKILHIITWLLLGCWFTVVMGFVTRSSEALLCREIIVSISDSVDVQFVTSERVREKILQSGINTQGYPAEQIQTRELEHLLEKDPYVFNAEVYTNIDGNLMVDIRQRKPLIRVMPGGKRGFYLDHEYTILPLSDNYSPMTLLLSGDVAFPEMEAKNGMKSADLAGDPELEQLISFAEMVDRHPFWSRQIMQIYRSEDGTYELIPRVGAHQILLGSLDDYQTKLRNLKLLYEQGFSKYGWNNYEQINLKYSNQIICTKR